MKKCHLTLLALFLLATPGPARAAAVADAEADLAIARLREGLVESFNRGDVVRLLTYLDTNAVVTWQNGEVCEGPAAVKAYYDRMMNGSRPVVSKVSANPKVLGRHTQGDWAVSWGNLNDEFVLTDGRQLPLNSRFTASVVKRGDRWLVSAFHVSVNAFDNPILALAIKKTAMFGGLGGMVLGILIGAAGMGMLRRRKAA